jgi:PAS domain S-box-containing protein
MASRARYADLYNRAPVGYFILNQAGSIRKANLTAARLLRTSRGALIKQPLISFIVPEDQNIYDHHKAQLATTGARQVCELRMLRAEGEPCWVRLEATSAMSTSGAVIVRAVVSDITARRDTEDTLRASEARHRIFFEESHDAMMTISSSPDWHITAANSATLRMFGAADEKDFLSRALREYSPTTQLDGTNSAEKARVMLASAWSEGSYSCDWTCRRLSGRLGAPDADGD